MRFGAVAGEFVAQIALFAHIDQQSQQPGDQNDRCVYREPCVAPVTKPLSIVCQTDVRFLAVEPRTIALEPAADSPEKRGDSPDILLGMERR